MCIKSSIHVHVRTMSVIFTCTKCASVAYMYGPMQFGARVPL